MSEIIDQVMKKYREVFIARKDEVEIYLKKYYSELFSERKVKKIERIDATRLIKSLGFRKNLSSWRNSYDNLVVSTCIKIKGDKKRYNYKFYFIEEKLDSEVLKQLENLIIEINNLKDRCEFTEVYKRLNFAESLIKDKKDVYFNKRLSDLKTEVINAENVYEDQLKIIGILENEVEKCESENNFKGAMEKVEQIIQYSREINHWEKIKQYTQKNIDLKKKHDIYINETINDLEDFAFLKRDEKEFIEAINCYKKIIDLLKKNKKKDLIEGYQNLIEEIKSDKDKYEEEKKLKDKKIEEILNKYYLEITIKEQEQANLIKEVYKYSPMIEIPKEVLPFIEEFSIRDVLGDLFENIKNQEIQLETLLEVHRVNVKTKICNKGIIIRSSGELIELEQDINVKKIRDDEREVIYDVQIKLENQFDDIIKEAILTDLIPYNFEIINVDINKEKKNGILEKILTKDGLEMIWKLKEIQPNEKIEITYDLRHRISRTIIFILETQLKIIKTHINIEEMSPKIQGFYESNINFINTGPTQIKGVIIEDIIPLYYIHNIIEPKNISPIITQSNSGDLIKWNIGTMDVDSINHRYKLIESFKFEELMVLVNKIDEEAYLNLLNNNIDDSIEKYNEILGLINDFLS